MNLVRAAVFASGTGSNFQAIMDESNLGCDVVLLVCDQPGAPVLEKAAAYGIPTFVFDAKKYAAKEEYEKNMIIKLQEADVTWVFLAGYMRIVGKTLLQAFGGKIINIHPSLLPAFPGKDAIGQAIQAGVNKTGVTVHYIDEGIDTGPIIVQEEMEVLPNDTRYTLQKRLQKVEHRLYPRVIKRLIRGK